MSILHRAIPVIAGCLALMASSYAAEPATQPTQRAQSFLNRYGKEHPVIIGHAVVDKHWVVIVSRLFGTVYVRTVFGAGPGSGSSAECQIIFMATSDASGPEASSAEISGSIEQGTLTLKVYAPEYLLGEFRVADKDPTKWLRVRRTALPGGGEEVHTDEVHTESPLIDIEPDGKDRLKLQHGGPKDGDTRQQ